MKTKRIISILTTFCLIASCFTGMLSVSAEEAVPEPISAETVCAAILSTDSTINVTATQEEGYVGVAITSELLKEHENGKAELGHWAGFAVVAPEGATYLKYAFGTSDELTLSQAHALTDEDVVTADGKKGIAFYADAGSKDASTYAKLQWLSDETTAMSAETTFVMNLDGINLDGVAKEDVNISALDKKTEYVDLTGVQDGDDVSVDFSNIKMEYYGYGEPVTEFDVANVADSNENEAERLSSVYDEGSYKVELINGYEIRISMKNLAMHKNALQEDGHWTGFTVKAPEGAKKLTYRKSFRDDWYTPHTIPLAEGQTSESFYINVTECDDTEKIVLQWLDENDSPISDSEWYEINLSNVEIAAEKEVTFETANVCDSFPGENAPAKVYGEYSVENDADTIKITMTDLALHRNANKTPGYWTGFTVNAPEGAKKLTYKKNFGDEWYIPHTITFEEGQTSESFYFDVMDGYYNGSERTITLQFCDENDRPITRRMTYGIDNSDVEIKYPEEYAISEAIVADSDSAEPVYEEYDVACEGDTIKLSATNLKKHTNGIGEEGHWIGFSVEAPEGATHYTYNFGNSYGDGNSREDTPVALGDGETSVSFYVNASSPDAKEYLEIRWYCDADEPVSYPYVHAYDYSSYYIDLTAVDIADDVPVDVTAANIVNQNAPETAPYTGTPSATVENGTIMLAVEGLKTHFNGNNDLGAWVGAAISRPEGAEYVKYLFENNYSWWGSAAYVPADEVADENTISFYADAYNEAPKNTIMLQWFDENEVAITNILTYKLDLSGVDYLVADEAEISFEKTNIVDQSNPEAPAYVDKYDVQLENDTIKLSADCIKTHINAEGDEGAWIGFKASVEGAKYLKYVFGNDNWYYYDWYNAEQAEVSGSESFYVDASAYDSKNFVMLQWFDENGTALTNINTYKIDIEKVTTEASFRVLFSNIKLTGEDARFYNLAPNGEQVERVSNADYVYVLANVHNGSVELKVNGTDESNGGNVFYRDETKTVTLTATPDSGYVFNGWYDMNNNMVSNTASYELTLDDCYLLYARFNTAYSGSTGGGGGSARFTVRFETNGGNSVSSVKVNKNGTIKSLPTPTRDGYKFVGWYTDKELTVAFDASAKITKTMTLYAKWEAQEKTEQPSSGLFTDVAQSAWYYEAVKYVKENGLFGGVSETEFAPNLALTRAMLVTVLYRAEGEPEVDEASNFTDVADGQYYAKAVAWAQSNNIVKGISETEFAPDANITREQMAAIIYRYASFKGAAEQTDAELDYSDLSDISDWAEAAVAFCKEKNIMTGKGNNEFKPLDNATRAEAAAILQRYFTNK